MAYWEHPFPGNEKVFTCPDRKSLEEVLDKGYDAGYHDTMIIQDFITGESSRITPASSSSVLYDILIFIIIVPLNHNKKFIFTFCEKRTNTGRPNFFRYPVEAFKRSYIFRIHSVSTLC